MKAFKLTDGIDLTIEEGQQIKEEPFFSNSKDNNKNKNLESSLASNTPLIPVIMLLNKVTSTNTDFDHSVEQLCNPCIENKYIKIVKHKKITPTTYKLKEIYADL